MLPPISKLDANLLNQLSSCEHLAISSNSISSMIGLPSGMKDLRILSLGRNRIKKLDQLEQCANSLQQLWISYNEIESLSGGGLDKCFKLTHLYISNNKIKKLDELNRIVSDERNPCYDGWQPSDIRRLILFRLPQLQKIDGAPVTERERIAAASLTEEESRMTPAQMYAAQMAKEKAERALKEQSEEPTSTKGTIAGANLSKKKKSKQQPDNSKSHTSPVRNSKVSQRVIHPVATSPRSVTDNRKQSTSSSRSPWRTQTQTSVTEQHVVAISPVKSVSIPQESEVRDKTDAFQVSLSNDTILALSVEPIHQVAMDSLSHTSSRRTAETR